MVAVQVSHLSFMLKGPPKNAGNNHTSTLQLLGRMRLSRSAAALQCRLRLWGPHPLAQGTGALEEPGAGKFLV